MPRSRKETADCGREASCFVFFLFCHLSLVFCLLCFAFSFFFSFLFCLSSFFTFRFYLFSFFRSSLPCSLLFSVSPCSLVPLFTRSLLLFLCSLVSLSPCFFPCSLFPCSLYRVVCFGFLDPCSLILVPFFFVCCSLFLVPCSLFLVPRSSVLAPCSLLLVPCCLRAGYILVVKPQEERLMPLLHGGINLRLCLMRKVLIDSDPLRCLRASAK